MSAVLHSFCCCCCNNTAWQHADPCLISRAQVAAQALHFIHSVGYNATLSNAGFSRIDGWSTAGLHPRSDIPMTNRLQHT
ncbi:unnamed protein product [Mycena citricolor]|uniref:Uncharacterized protein n=1 Tax=Mycena citricolor TaxID=2018698 RepID=A0AAD2H289_9AGAR|nr:unnamed protein product [Mycena citricolor]